MENEQILAEVKSMTSLIEKLKADSEKKTADITASLEQKLAEYKAAAETKTGDELKAIQKEMQDQYDAFASQRESSKKAEVKHIDTEMTTKLSGVKFNEGMENELTAELRAKKSFKIDMPEVKTMSLAGGLTGDAVASYGPRQAVLPSQKVNFRDLIPTLNTETGLYVFYKETVTPNNIAFQGEGCTKGENSYTLSEVKIVQNYLAGTVTFSKQMATSLPWLTTTLPRMLMRDFFKKENALFYASVNGVATVDTSAETDYVKKIVDFITAQQTLNYNASVVIVSYEDMGSLIKSTYTNGYYSGAGGIILNGQANGVTIAGVPVIGASWATNGRALIFDADFLERVQVKGLAIELSYENNDNFVKNMVTARIECQEEINLMLAASASYCTLY
jgi:HK97 family phage major capsid protein